MFPYFNFDPWPVTLKGLLESFVEYEIREYKRIRLQ